jgi:hypothetical protein
LFAELKKIKPANLDVLKAIKNNKDRAFNKQINSLIKKPKLSEYFKTKIFKCYVKNKEYRKSNLFIQTLKQYKYDVINDGRNYLKELISEKENRKPAQDYKNEYLKEFENYKISDDKLTKLQETFLIFNFEQRFDSDGFFSENNLKGIKHFLTFIECFEYNKDIEFKNIYFKEMNKLIRLFGLNKDNADENINKV